MKSLTRLIVWIVVAEFFSYQPSLRALPVTYKTLDPPNDTSSMAFGVSGNNVVGYYVGNGNVQHGFFYNGSTYSTLDPTGSTATTPIGVSGNNVVGYYVGSGNVQHGFFYNGSTYSTLDPTGSTDTEANAVSGNNVVGQYTDVGGITHGFLYNGSTYTTLDPPGTTNTVAIGISGSNVVGLYTDGSGVTHGFLYNSSTYTTLDPPGSTYTNATGVSDNNVVGEYTDVGGITHGFLYNGSTYTTLDPPGTTNTVAIGISGSTVVGEYTDSSSVHHGFLYNGGNYTTLDPPGTTNTAAFAVSGSNVVGWSANSSSVNHAFLANAATATVTLGSLAATYNGLPQPATATTVPSGLNVIITYNGSSIAPTNAGSYTVVATVNDPNYLGSATGTLVISPSSSTSISFSQWQTNYSITSSASATPENDGIPNLLKYLYDINPTVPMNALSRAALPSLGITTISGTQYLTLTYRQYKAETGVAVILQTSSDLQTWTPQNTPDVSRQMGTDPITEDPIMQVGMALTGSKQFLRLSVTATSAGNQVYVGNLTEAQAPDGQFVLDSTFNYSIWQEVNRDNNGNITNTSGLVVNSVSDGVWFELQYNTVTGLPNNLISSTGIDFTFTSFDSTNMTATANLVVNGTTTATGILIQLDGLLTAQSGTSPAVVKVTHSAVTTNTEAQQSPIDQYFPDIILLADSINKSVKNGAIQLPEASEATFEFGVGVLDDQILDLDEEVASGTTLQVPVDTSVDAVKLGFNSLACYQLLVLGTSLAIPTGGASYVPAAIACGEAYSNAWDLYNDVQEMSQAQRLALQGTLVSNAANVIAAEPYDYYTVYISGTVVNGVVLPPISEGLPPPDLNNWISSSTSAIVPLKQLQELDSSLPDYVTPLTTGLISTISDYQNYDNELIGDLQSDESDGYPSAASYVPQVQTDYSVITSDGTAVNALFPP